ncbi:cache domain-containing protein, partial [Litorivivens sp.]
MRRKRSLIQIYLVSMIALAAVPVAINGAIWIATEYDSFTEQSENLRKTFVESRTELLKREVSKAIDYVDYKKSQLNHRLYQELRQEVAVALALVANLHRETAATDSRSAMLARVKTTLEPLRFHDQKGFFFALQGDGNALLAPLHPSSRDRLRRSAVLSNFTEQVHTALRDKTYGMLEYRFNEANLAAQRNISFVYYFKPLDLYIGASVYLADEIERIKSEVIDRLAAVPFDVDSSILFVTDLKGKQLVNPYNPAMVGKLQPGMAAVAEVLQTASDNGELVESEWVRADGARRSPAVSYVQLEEDWGWLVGAGFFLDEYYALMEAERDALEARVLRHTLFISSIALALMLVATLV